MFKAGSERLVKRLLAPPVGSFWLSLRSPPSICILCEKGGHWLTRFSKFVLFSCPFLDLCWQFCLQTIHGVNITPTELSLPCNFLMLWSDAITKWRNTKDWKVTEKYSHHNTATMVSATPRHFLFWARLLEFRSFTFSLAYSFRPLQVVVRHYLFFAVERASRWVSQ